MTTPFGGYKLSGFGGHDKSVHAHDQYTETKTIWIQLRGTGVIGVGPRRAAVQGRRRRCRAAGPKPMRNRSETCAKWVDLALTLVPSLPETRDARPFPPRPGVSVCARRTPPGYG